MTMAIIDTSFLLLIAKGIANLDRIKEEMPFVELYVSKPVIEELEKLSNESSERGRLARWVLSTLIGKVVKILDLDCEGEEFDERILCTASKSNALLLTADLEMARIAKRKGIKVAVYRSARRGLETFFSVL